MEFNKINYRSGLTKREKSNIVANHFNRIKYNLNEVAAYFIYQVKSDKNVSNSHSKVEGKED